ncbi:hypothetical protein B0H15DRAFT_938478 [Mycena belliarum]|uniref:Uncharacterized protein n=1 Tax=Mycena belliarum TaxID=1033014 RepID=A0AAD6U6M5_9AGAR|nr:hypothetical protein B0H15DRAFT_938478 [Mycena belliae]
MPITFAVANHPANPIGLRPLALEGLTAKGILALSCQEPSKKADQVLQFALSDSTGDGGSRDLDAKFPYLIPKKNGFVDTVILAYNQHHALVIRPDDVWLAILSQFSFFVNGNAELLRACFVSHEGKKKLRVEMEGTRNTLVFGDMSRKMVRLIEENVVDPTLREWVLPNFTTTTVNDTTVSAVLMMATLEQYFAYEFCLLECGIPRVTLEGEKSDWLNILQRLEKLKEYGVEAIAWYHLLRTVIGRITASFDAPHSHANVEFWQKVAHFESGGSGSSYYSGWINAFNAFDAEGKWLGTTLGHANMDLLEEAPECLSAELFWAAYAGRTARELMLDGTPFHLVESDRVPAGYAEVDVKVQDEDGTVDCVMTAGMIGMRVSSSDDLGLSAIGKNDTVRPVAGWWIFTKNDA